MTRLIPLGVNGFIPSYGRHTASYLLLTEREAILLDAGTGMSRLLEPSIRTLLNPYRTLNIILSHYHLDHVVGLSYLPATWPRGRIRLFAPTAPLVDTEAASAIGQLLSPPLFSLPLREFPGRIELNPVEGPAIRLGKLAISFRRQKHPGGSVAIRIDDQIAYLTDTAADSDSIAFIRGASFLLHEVWLTDEEAEELPGEVAAHSYCSAVRDISRRSGIKCLMPVHLHPRHSNEDLERFADRLQVSDVSVQMPREGQVYKIV